MALLATRDYRPSKNVRKNVIEGSKGNQDTQEIHNKSAEELLARLKET